MALPWALAALGLLPLLTAQDPTCAYPKAVPITNATLDGNQCIYNVSSGGIQRQNGTLFHIVQDREHFAHPWLTKDADNFTLLFFLEDEENRGLGFYARKQEVTKEQLREFQEALKCMGLQDNEILYTDGKKDLCRPLEKQHEEERKKGNTES